MTTWTDDDRAPQADSAYPLHELRPPLLYWLSIIGFLGVASIIGGTIVAPFFVPDYDRVADTISDLAAGEMEIIMDVALYGFAAGVMATALAASHDHLGRRGWSFGVLSLALIAGLVIVVGARNEYGDGDSEGVVIHMYLVYGLGVLFAAVPALMFNALRHHAPWAAWSMAGLGVAWVIVSPVFLLMGTAWDGFVERVLGLIACAMIVVLNIVFLNSARQRR